MVCWQFKIEDSVFSLYIFILLKFWSDQYDLNPAGLEVCLRCKKRVKGNEAGLECALCHYWFYTKCEGAGADLYKVLQKV